MRVISVLRKSRRANRMLSLCMSLNPGKADDNVKQGVLLRTIFRMIRKRIPTVAHRPGFEQKWVSPFTERQFKPALRWL